MKIKFTPLLGMLLLCLPVMAQTNSDIQSTFSAGVQVSTYQDKKFQGDMPYPERFLKYTHEGDKLHIDCDNGYVDIQYHSSNIVHFAYYLSYKSRSFGWAIKPSYEIVDTKIKYAPHNHIHFVSSDMVVDIDPITASLVYKDSVGNTLLTSSGYSLKPVNVQGEATYQSALIFDAPEDEHYYGLGQHQSGLMDHRGTKVQLWHDYNSKDGEVISIPFMLTNKGYAIVYDNPSRTTVTPGVDGKTVWSSEVSEAISYYVIYGESIDDIFRSYGELCGYAPLPPKKALGYIQCKQRYKTEKEILSIANKYVEKDYPIDYMVVDWFHWDKLGDLSLNPKFWPNPKGMNEELKSKNINCMVSVWPRFVSESKHFDILNKNGWLMREKCGLSMNGTAWDRRGGVIDTSNPEAASWYWDRIKENYLDKGFDSFWLDESEPDVIPHNYYLHEGLGARVYNLYPYYHAKCLYDGQRSENNERVFVLTRSAYLGTHQFGTTFWSSDIFPEWDVLKRQVACGVNFAASGLPYWSSDIGGWQSFQPTHEVPDTKLLLTSEVGPRAMYKDYPEMYVRWFQYSVFCPTFRAHGTRSENEVWSYGDKAEEILVDFLELRYKLMPYIYSNAWSATTQNSPIMRGLFIDFTADENVADIKDQYMFGKSLLVAPITDAGVTSREVYLPNGTVWYDFWTNKKLKGGTTVKSASPIEKIPLFVKGGSILPKVNNLKRADEKVTEIDLYIYTGSDATFTLYSDDASTYDYEDGKFATVDLLWSDSKKELTIADRQGEYEGMVKDVKFNIIVASSSSNAYNAVCKDAKSVSYSGKSQTVQF